MLLGSHLSIAGGPVNALLSAERYGFRTVAMFVRNQRQWKAPRLGDEAVAEFRRVRRRLGIRPIVAHGSYLVNLAGRAALRRKSITAVREDLDRCGRLGIEYLVLHPGSRDNPAAGIALIADGLNRILDACRHRRPKILLETTSACGRSIGGTFEQLAGILAKVRRPRRVGVCLDTCHVFAAGYDIRTASAWWQTRDQLDAAVGLKRVLAIHLNDSLRPLGSGVDRHAHIGRGEIGRKGFAAIISDPHLAAVPMILETPKGTDDKGLDWDEINAKTLRRLARK